MCKRAACLMVLTLVMGLGVAADAAITDITEIEIVQLYGGQSAFSPLGGTYSIGLLNTNFSNGAILKTVANPGGAFYYSSANTSTSLENDNSYTDGSEEVLFGDYNGGSWSLQLFTDAGHLNKVLDAFGSITWYEEEEEVPQKVDGRAICHINYMWTNLPDTTWGGDGITCGYRSTSTVFDVNPLEDYGAAFNAGVVTMTVYADPTGIPEPATIALLGLSGLALLRRKRRA